MKIKIQEQKENQLLNRIDMKIEIESAKTPTRKEMLKQIAAETGKDDDAISIDSISQEYGVQKSIAYVKIYNNKEDKVRFENKYTLERTEGKKEAENKPVEEKTE